MKKLPARERTYVRFKEKAEDEFLAVTGPIEASVQHILCNVYLAKANSAGGAGCFRFTIDRIPKSLNHQYIVRGRGRAYDFDPEIKALRDELAYRLAPMRRQFVPKGVLAAIIEFQSPKWVTKENTVRDMDWDNKVKPLFDAFEKATGIRDSRFWAGHIFKRVGPKEQTTMCVYDLGDIVDRTL